VYQSKDTQKPYVRNRKTGEEHSKYGQMLSNAEAYEFFKAEFEKQVQDCLRRHSTDKFPSFTYFVKNKPFFIKYKEPYNFRVCKHCFNAKEKHKAMMRALKEHCKHGTKTCKNWKCKCGAVEGEETEDVLNSYCTCDGCSCQECNMCWIKSDCCNHFWKFMLMFFCEEDEDMKMSEDTDYYMDLKQKLSLLTFDYYLK